MDKATKVFLEYYLWKKFMWKYRDALEDQGEMVYLLRALMFWWEYHYEEADPHIAEVFGEIMYDYFIVNGDWEIGLADEFIKAYKDILNRWTKTVNVEQKQSS